MAKFARKFNIPIRNSQHNFWVFACQKQLDMQSPGWKSLLYWILLASNGANFCCTVDAAWAKNSNLWGRKDQSTSTIPYDTVTKVTSKPRSQKRDQQTVREKVALDSKALNIHDTLSGAKKSRQIAPPDSFASPAFSKLLSSRAVITPAITAPQPSPAPSSPQPNPDSPPAPQAPQANLGPPESPISGPANNQQRNEPPLLEGQPINFPTPYSTPVEPQLKVPETDSELRLKRLLRRLQEQKQPTSDSNSDGELGRLLLRRQENNTEELGRLLLRERPLEQLPPPPSAQPVVKSKPIGYLLANVGIFHTTNIFSSVNPIEDSLYYSGLTLATAPLPLGSNTYINGSIDGSLIRYVNQSKYNYNQVRFNLSLYQQLSPQMYGEIGWSNQQLFYARNSSDFSAGDRFLNENSLRLSLGRRDILNTKLFLDSYYELRFSFTDPPNKLDNRDRVTNALSISLNYYLQKSLQVGFDYQFGLSNFTQRFREDQYYRLFAHLTYGIAKDSNISVQGGWSLGNSTDSTLNFDGWFFTVNYNLELGRF